MKPLFFVMTWCWSQVWISTGVSNGPYPGFQCYDSEYNVFESTPEMLAAYKALNTQQQESARQFKMQEISIQKTFEVKYST